MNIQLIGNIIVLIIIGCIGTIYYTTIKELGWMWGTIVFVVGGYLGIKTYNIRRKIERKIWHE